jgi:hypothetical protein
MARRHPAIERGGSSGVVTPLARTRQAPPFESASRMAASMGE